MRLILEIFRYIEKCLRICAVCPIKHAHVFARLCFVRTGSRRYHLSLNIMGSIPALGTKELSSHLCSVCVSLYLSTNKMKDLESSVPGRCSKLTLVVKLKPIHYRRVAIFMPSWPRHWSCVFLCSLCGVWNKCAEELIAGNVHSDDCGSIPAQGTALLLTSL